MKMDNLQKFGTLGQEAENQLELTKGFLNTEGMPFEFVRDQLVKTVATLVEMVAVAEQIINQKAQCKADLHSDESKEEENG
jgi:hypothetical protein